MGRRASTFSLTALTTLKAKFADAAPRNHDEVERSEALEMLRPSVELMKSKGYSVDEILIELDNGGVKIGITTLKAMLRTPAKKSRPNRRAGEKFCDKTPAPVLQPQAKPAAALSDKTPAPVAGSFQDPDEK